MVKKGISLSFKENYLDEIDYVRSLGFEFFQIWFINGTINVETLQEPKEEAIKDAKFPIILHVLFDLPDFEKYSKKLLYLIDYFEHKEVIIHPVCKTEQITKNTIFQLERKIGIIYKELKIRNVKLYVENNSVIDGFFNTVSDLRIIFDKYQDIGLLLDIAHINNYDHLKEIVQMRFPECIHITDKHFGISHEHLPLGEGELDFNMIFGNILKGYDGRIILEIIHSKNAIEKSNKILEKIFK